jgi:hypothetical protein
MKKSLSFTSAVVLSIGGSVPSHAEAHFSQPDHERRITVIIDPVILNLDEDGPAGDLNPGEGKYVA